MKIFFVHQRLTSFIKKDLDILQTAHQVRSLRFRGLQDVPALVSGTLWADLIFSWFGKLHAFFAVLFSNLLGKKAVVVAGGDDVAYEPEINYGMFVHWWKKWCPLLVFRYADLILSVSNFTHRETIENAKADPAKVRRIYHGFDLQKWHTMDNVAKENLVCTVGKVTNETLRKKGLELFVQSAAYMPDVPFAVIGPWYDNAIDRLQAISPPNVSFTGGLYGDSLLQIYNQAKVYVQASIHESFGCSLAEAMLCECVPVVSRRAALPEVIGDCGFYIDELIPEFVAVKIKQALNVNFGKKARERIANLFPLEKRRDQLLKEIFTLFGDEAEEDKHF